MKKHEGTDVDEISTGLGKSLDDGGRDDGGGSLRDELEKEDEEG